MKEPTRIYYGQDVFPEDKFIQDDVIAVSYSMPSDSTDFKKLMLVFVN